MSKKIQVTIPDETYKVLEEQARDLKIKLTTWVTAVIRRAVENGNDRKSV